MPRNSKGARRERELISELDAHGFVAMRAPSSGSATPRELPDAIAGNGDVALAIEAKASSGDPIYLSGEEIEALEYFARNFGAVALVGVRFDYCDWRFFDPDDLHATEGGNRRVKKDVLDDGLTLSDLSE